MRWNNPTGPMAKSETGPPTAEHRKAAGTGHVVLYAALALLVFSIAAMLAGFTAAASVAGGLFVAFAVVGLLLHFEGERQRQRPDTSGPSPAK